MQPKREQVLVGLFVLVAVTVLFATVFTMSGAAGKSTTTFHAYFPFAGGLEPGATVRYAGGPKVGRVEKLQLDPKDPTRIEITFSVRTGLPGKTDSRVKIMSFSPTGDNHLQIVPGNAKSPLTPAGTILSSVPYVDFNELTGMVSDLGPKAQLLLRTLNDPATQLKV